MSVGGFSSASSWLLCRVHAHQPLKQPLHIAMAIVCMRFKRSAAMQNALSESLACNCIYDIVCGWGPATASLYIDTRILKFTETAAKMPSCL